MKRFLIVLISMFISIMVLGQIEQPKSDLYIAIDSIIKYEIGYTIDSTTGQLIGYDSTELELLLTGGDTANIQIRCLTSNLPKHPLIILSSKHKGLSVNIESLNQFELKNVKSIITHSMNNKTVMAIYGFRGQYGLIVIHLKRNRKINRKLKDVEPESSYY